MRPVLLEANRTCASAWVPIGRGLSRVRVSGLQDRDFVRVVFPDGLPDLTFRKDGVFPIPPNAERIMAEARIFNDGTRLNVDLVGDDE